jgi:L-asparaginase II
VSGGWQADPVVAHVVRNGFVESVHRGRVVVLDADGGVVASAGDVAAPILPRSALKPIQAIALCNAGWEPADAQMLALACASHSGEERHVAVVRRILAAAGLAESALQNTPDLPLDVAAAHALLRAGGHADAIHQNCSGKHAAMLATCVVNGWPTEGYLDPTSPVQRAIRQCVESYAGEPVAATVVDGCGAPQFGVSLRAVAGAFLAIADTAAADAMRAHPDLVGGAGRDVTRLMQAVPGVVAKDGAEGVYVAAVAGVGSAAVKIDDGAGRARAPVLAAALRLLDLDAGAVADVPVLGHGRPVGEIAPVWP